MLVVRTCVVCETEFSYERLDGPGRPRLICSRACWRRRRARRPKPTSLTCADCHKPMARSRTSRPQGQARCLPCRRANPTRARWTAKTLPCQQCHDVFTQRRSGQLYCSTVCRDSRRGHRFRTITTRKGNTAERGYGTQHQAARRAAAALHTPSDPCSRCGQPLGPMSRHLHYDHTDDRTGYLGFSHAACNQLAAARRRPAALRPMYCAKGCCEIHAVA